MQQRFYNEDTNWGVYAFISHDDIPYFDPLKSKDRNDFYTNCDDERPAKFSILTGKVQQLYLGTSYQIEANVVYNAKYKSYQYDPITVIPDVPKTQEQQKAFLSLILTSRQCETILATYPNIVEDVINGNDNVDISRLNGIGHATWNDVRDKIINNYVMSDIITMLQPLGVTYGMISKLSKAVPNPTLLKEQLVDNPYIMTRIRGLGFKRVDDMALKINPGLNVSIKRTYAFIKYFLNQEAENNGHTWVKIDALTAAVQENIAPCMDIFQNEVLAGESSVILHFDNDKVGLHRYYELEMNIFAMLSEINSAPVDTSLEYEKGIANAQEAQGFNYTEEQVDVIKRALSTNVTTISGKAGTGKSTIARGIISVLKESRKSVSCAALSAKAAQRLEEATGHKATTIHRMLGWSGDGFNYNHVNPLLSDVVIIDESSMINATLFAAVIAAVKPGGRLFLFGDNRQLPPIGCGNIFSDLLEHVSDFNNTYLTKVQRQAEDSGILMDANQIREGINPIGAPVARVTTGKLADMTYMFRDDKSTLHDIAVKTFLKAVEQDGVDNVALIVPRKNDCENSTASLNKNILDKLIPNTTGQLQYGDKVFRVGAKVMNVENDYENNVFNGETGYVTNIYPKASGNSSQWFLDVEFNTNGEKKIIPFSKSKCAQLELAYAITIHKSQGSGYNTVVTVIDSSSYILLDSCLLYTAMTRAKKRCLLLSQPKAFSHAIHTNKGTSRNTWLSVK